MMVVSVIDALYNGHVNSKNKKKEERSRAFLHDHLAAWSSFCVVQNEKK